MKKNIDVDLIDDDAAVLDALTQCLGQRGFTVRSYSSASEFLMGREQKSPSDCIVASLKMSDISGLDLHATLAKMGCPAPLS